MARTSDTDILKAIRTDPEVGFHSLMSLYNEPVYWHIRRLVAIHQDAQDATQETFIRVFRNLDKFRGQSSLKAWIYRIATNEALRVLSNRRGTEVSLDSESIPEPAADEEMDYSDLEAVRLSRAIAALPPRQQAVFNMRYYDEMSYDDIARALNSTTASAKVNYHLAKERIIKQLELKN